MQAMWNVRPADPPRARALADATGIHQITAQLLLNRGVTTCARAAQFLRPNLAELDDPHALLPDLAQGIARIRQAVSRREPILIFGDSDVDGLTASVMLYEVLRALGAQVRAVQSNRITDGYGIPDALIKKISRSSTALVILVDCGTNQPDVVDTLARHQIDTIIIDHHVPLDGWAKPHALINPHREQGAGRELCSAGLVWMVARVLLQGRGDASVAALLDLAALGTLADCVPLVGANRAIVSEGLGRILHSERPGLRRLCEATRTLQPEPEQMIRRLIPRLNASGRLGDSAAVWHALRADQSSRLDGWLEAAASAHATTKQWHRQVLGEAQEQINRMHFRDQYVMVVSRAGWPQGVMGPLASQLAERYGRPAIAIAFDEHEGVGSGRSVPRFDLLNALKECQQLLVRFGGHAQACGLTLRSRHVESFRALVNTHAKARLGPEGLVPTRVLDLELPLAAMQASWVEETERLAPFGRGNPRPTVVIRRVMIETHSPRTGWASDGSRRMKVKGSLPEPAAGVRYDLAATPTAADGEVVLRLLDVKVSTGPS